MRNKTNIHTHTHTSKQTPTLTNRSKHIPSTSGSRERDIEHLLIVSNKLSFDMTRNHVDSAERLTCFQTPYGAGGVNGGGADQVGLYLIPVKRGKRCTEVRVFVLRVKGGKVRLG